MKIAYADPPYIGLAKKFYSHDPRCAEVDHEKLILELEDFDGWALSLHSPSLKQVLSYCPDNVRVGAWVKPFCSWKNNVNPAYAWEPIIFKPARKPKGKRTVRDWIAESITLKRGLVGAKPQLLCFWVFDILGARPGDQFFDLYPGTGAVSLAWDQWANRKNLEFEQQDLLQPESAP